MLVDYNQRELNTDEVNTDEVNQFIEFNVFKKSIEFYKIASNIKDVHDLLVNKIISL